MSNNTPEPEIRQDKLNEAMKAIYGSIIALTLPELTELKERVNKLIITRIGMKQQEEEVDKLCGYKK